MHYKSLKTRVAANLLKFIFTRSFLRLDGVQQNEEKMLHGPFTVTGFT